MYYIIIHYELNKEKGKQLNSIVKTTNFAKSKANKRNLMKEINIYGDIVAFKYWDDDSEFDLKDLKNALSSIDIEEGGVLTVNIHTYGGDTTTAFGMYNLLKRFKTENKVSIKTRVDGYCASSGVILLLAGDIRVGSNYLKPFVHNAWIWLWDGINKDEAKKIYEDLEAVDNAIAELYASETSISKEEALQFMNESRDLTTEECQKYGFYTELENVVVVDSQNAFKAVISRNIQNRKNNFKMDKSKKSAWNALINQAKKFFSETQNKIVFTATNEELDFYELGEDDTPKVGDKATFDGKPAGESNEGVFVIANGDTYRFEGEELKEITPKEDEDNGDEEMENLKTENAELKTENEAKDLEISNLKKELSKAKNIIKGFNDLANEDEEDEKEERDPKETPSPKRNLFKNLK